MKRYLALLLVAGCGGSLADPSRATDPVTSPDGGGHAASAGWTTLDAEGDVTALVTTDTAVCWTSHAAPSSSLVACASKSDGRRVVFERGGGPYPGLAVSGTDLYWSNEMTATITRAPLDGGGAPEAVVTASGPHGRFAALRGGELYWLLDGGDGTWLFRGVAGAKPTPIVNLGASDTDLLAVVEYTVYDYPLAFAFRGGVRRVRLSGADAAQDLVSKDCFYPTDLTSDVENVYWSCQDGTLHAVSRNGGAERVEQGAGWGRLATFVAPASSVVATDTPGGRVLRLREGSGFDVVAHGLDRPSAVAVDASGIYVGEGRRVRRVQ